MVSSCRVVEGGSDEQNINTHYTHHSSYEEQAWSFQKGGGMNSLKTIAIAAVFGMSSTAHAVSLRAEDVEFNNWKLKTLSAFGLLIR